MVWIDCEMTGLDPDRHTLIEIATIITDFDLNIIDRGPDLAIKLSPAKIKDDGPVVPAHPHSQRPARALQDRGRRRWRTPRRRRWVSSRSTARAKTAPLCGNSVWQDKRFISEYMPAIERYLHYRIVDVSSIKLMTRHWFPNQDPPAKQETHRALLDIEESIAELRFYRTVTTGAAGAAI